MIAPEVAKAGFIFGGSGGRAVLLVRNAKTGRWMGPAFYTLSDRERRLPGGVSVSEMMTLVMTDKGSIRCCPTRSRWVPMQALPRARSA